MIFYGGLDIVSSKTLNQLARKSSITKLSKYPIWLDSLKWYDEKENFHSTVKGRFLKTQLRAGGWANGLRRRFFRATLDIVSSKTLNQLARKVTIFGRMSWSWNSLSSFIITNGSDNSKCQYSFDNYRMALSLWPRLSVAKFLSQSLITRISNSRVADLIIIKEQPKPQTPKTIFSNNVNPHNVNR